MTRTNAANRLPHGDGVVGLLASIFDNGPPKLTNAACVGQPELFDAANASADDIEAAKSLCTRCECFTDCAAWASGQRHLVGVVAGKYHRSKRYDRAEDTETNDETQRGTAHDKP